MALHPQKVEWQRLVEPQTWNLAQVKLSVWCCELMEMGFGLLSSWPWLKWRGSCSRGYADVCGVVFFRRTSSGLPLERILWDFWALQLGGLFRKLKWLYEMKNEKIKGLNRHLNDGWYFCNLEVISQFGSQLDSQLRNWILKLQNGTRVLRRCFAAVKIFATW